ncbi:MAG: hypothetical protein ACXWKH_18675, partial [Limisphaerales bacterium]
MKNRSNVVSSSFLALTIWLCSGLCGWTQLDEQAKAQVQILAAYSQPIGDQTTAILKQAGYRPRVAADEWRSYPALRKLEFAYRAAEKAQTGKGKEVLAFVAAQLSERYDALSSEILLKPLLAVTPDVTTLQFARGPPTEDWPPLPPEAREQVRKLAEYSNRSIVGGTFDILIRDLKLDADQAHDIIVNSKSHTEALERGFASLSPEKRNAAMSELATKIAAHTEAIYFEPQLAALLPHDRPLHAAADRYRPSPPGGSSAGPSPSAGESPSSGPHGGVSPGGSPTSGAVGVGGASGEGRSIHPDHGGGQR